VGAFEGILLYVANTLSFVRLAAYAMSHAALMVAAFSLAAEVEKVAGRTLGWGVVLFGNLVALVLEGTVAAVQALRLEYYEFFGKFFHGDGRAFRPFVLGR
jgi:V/A-type H+-transporting ATPase subunit I